MKYLFLLILGIVIGGYAMHVYDRDHGDWGRGLSGDDSLRDRADTVRGNIADKLREWHLSGDDIRNDLARGGDVVRDKASLAGAKISDVRVVAVIDAKYILDRDLSARKIKVEATAGAVVLSGVVASPELIGKAIALALDTDGVRTVTSRLAVETHQ